MASKIDPTVRILLSMKKNYIHRSSTEQSKRRRVMVITSSSEQTEVVPTPEYHGNGSSITTSPPISSSSTSIMKRNSCSSSTSSSSLWSHSSFEHSSASASSSTRTTHKKQTQNNNHYDSKWLVMYERLLAFKKENNSCIVRRGVPQIEQEYPKLAGWVNEQRKQYKWRINGRTASLTDFRIGKLNEIGFIWNVNDHAWNTQLSKLRAYKEEHGNCQVPCSYPADPSLGAWANEQRRHYWLLQQQEQEQEQEQQVQGKRKKKKPQKSQMTYQRMSLLNEMGFVWDPLGSSWNEKIQALKEFKAKHGHCNVPRISEDMCTALGTWVHHQRINYKLFKENKPSPMNYERFTELEEIGFCWAARDHTDKKKNE